MRTFLFLILALPIWLAAQSCPALDSLAMRKKPKGIADRAYTMALDSAHCVAPYLKTLNAKTPLAKKFRKDVLTRQPEAMLAAYGLKELTLAEKRSVFLSDLIRDTLTCQQLVDSVGVDSLVANAWIPAGSPWDYRNFPCKSLTMPSILAKVDSQITEAGALRAKWMALDPSLWLAKYGESITEEEGVRYATHPLLLDSSNCRYADYANAEQLLRFGVPQNACYPYIHDRFGDAVIRLAFQSTFKPAVGAQIEKRLSGVTPENLDQIQGLLDTLEILFADGESWEAKDSLEASLLRLLGRVPETLKRLKEPNVTMMLSAFQGRLSLLCEFPNVNDRMVIKLLQDRYYAELPMPTDVEVDSLCSCLAPELCTAVRKVMTQVNSQ